MDKENDRMPKAIISLLIWMIKKCCNRCENGFNSSILLQYFNKKSLFYMVLPKRNEISGDESTHVLFIKVIEYILVNQLLACKSDDTNIILVLIMKKISRSPNEITFYNKLAKFVEIIVDMNLQVNMISDIHINNEINEILNCTFYNNIVSVILKENMDEYIIVYVTDMVMHDNNESIIKEGYLKTRSKKSKNTSKYIKDYIGFKVNANDDVNNSKCVVKKYYNLNNNNLINIIKNEVKFLNELSLDEDQYCVKLLCYNIKINNNYIVEECIHSDLGRIINYGKLVLDYHKSIDIIKKITQILLFLEKHYVVHCDIKASNFLICKEMESLKICDFGTSLNMKSIKKSQKKSSKNQINTQDDCNYFLINSLKYINSPPESRIKNYVVDYQYDVWGYSLLIYNVIFGEHIFHEMKGDVSCIMIENDYNVIIDKWNVIIEKMREGLNDKFKRISQKILAYSNLILEGIKPYDCNMKFCENNRGKMSQIYLKYLDIL